MAIRGWRSCRLNTPCLSMSSRSDLTTETVRIFLYLVSLFGLGNGCSADEHHGGLTSRSSVLLPSYVNTEDGTAQSSPWSCILPFTAFGGKVPSLIMQQVIMRGSEWSSNNKMKISCLRLSCDHPVDSKELRIENYS